jgi:hypothetical protein
MAKILKFQLFFESLKKMINFGRFFGENSLV